MKTLTKNQITRAEGTLAAATGGRNAWDTEVLRNAAVTCLAGGVAHEFRGRPEGSREFYAFSAAWRRVQNSRPAQKMTADEIAEYLAEELH